MCFLFVGDACKSSGQQNKTRKPQNHKTNTKGEERGWTWRTQSRPRRHCVLSVLLTVVPAPHSQNATCSKVLESSALCPPPGRGTAAFSCPGPLCEGMGAGCGAHRPGPPPSLTWPSQGGMGRPLWVAGRFRGWAQGQLRPWASLLDLFLFNYFLFCECVCLPLPRLRVKWEFWGNLFFPSASFLSSPSVASHQPSFLTRQRVEWASRGLGWPAIGRPPAHNPSPVASIPPALFKTKCPRL